MNDPYQHPVEPDDSLDNWKTRAQCRIEHVDPDAFFPVYRSGARRDRLRVEAAAKSVCSRCPVVAQCESLSVGAEFGIYGAKSARERAACG